MKNKVSCKNNTPTFELVCPAGTPSALEAAVDAGADAVYVGFRDETNARNFPGLNFSVEELKNGIAYAHQKKCKVFVAINTFARAGNPEPWLKALENVAHSEADAVILADIGILHHCQKHFPQLRRHLSVQASASNAEAIEYFHRAFDIKRVVLPRVLTIAEITTLNQQLSVETEVFAFGGLCVMAEGRCSLSSYVTGKSPNLCGVCSPASHVRYEERDGMMISTLANYTINAFRTDETAGYPTICKGRFIANGKTGYLFEEPVSLNTLSILDQLQAAGVRALKIEGRQRGRAYIEQVVKTFRAAIDAHASGKKISLELQNISEGQKGTSGSYEKGWQ